MMNAFESEMGGNIRKYLKDVYHIDVWPSGECKSLALKSPNEKVTIQGKLGFFYSRGKREESIELQLSKNCCAFYHSTDYKELSKKFDYVVVATGKN